MGINPQGLAAIVRTSGNPHLHVILRGSSDGPNYKAEFVKKARDDMVKARKDFHPSIMIDCSHGNSEKNHNNQPKVLADICTQLQAGDTSITGVMIEGHFNAGRQDVPPEGPSALKWGISLTDACVDMETTWEMLNSLNKVKLLFCSRKRDIDLFFWYRLLARGVMPSQMAAHKPFLQHSQDVLATHGSRALLDILIYWCCRSFIASVHYPLGKGNHTRHDLALSGQATKG